MLPIQESRDKGKKPKETGKELQKVGIFHERGMGNCSKKPPESILPILGKEGQDVNVFRKEMGEEMQWEMATSQREDPLFVFHERPSDNGN